MLCCFGVLSLIVWNVFVRWCVMVSGVCVCVCVFSSALFVWFVLLCLSMLVYVCSGCVVR